jgi:hypothetical protein
MKMRADYDLPDGKQQYSAITVGGRVVALIDDDSLIALARDALQPVMPRYRLH